MRIETIIDGLVHRSQSSNIELTVDNLFKDADKRPLSANVVNITHNKIGIISVNIKEYMDEPVCFFILHHKLHKYCIDEGFSHAEMLYNSAWKNKIFEKVDFKKFTDFMLGA